MNFKTTLLATGLLFAIGAPAYAWNNTISGNGQIVDGGPGAQANQRQNQHQMQHQNQHQTQRATGGNVTNNITEGGGYGSGSGGGNTVNNGGGFLTVPNLAGQASCSGSVTLGFLGTQAGGSGGGMWEFHDCKAVREADTLFAMGYKTQAVALLCQQIDRVKEAFGGSCPGSQSETTQAITANVPDYCFTRNAGDKNQHRECDHAPVTTVRGR